MEQSRFIVSEARQPQFARASNWCRTLVIKNQGKERTDNTSNASIRKITLQQSQVFNCPPRTFILQEVSSWAQAFGILQHPTNTLEISVFAVVKQNVDKKSLRKAIGDLALSMVVTLPDQPQEDTRSQAAVYPLKINDIDRFMELYTAGKPECKLFVWVSPEAFESTQEAAEAIGNIEKERVYAIMIETFIKQVKMICIQHTQYRTLKLENLKKLPAAQQQYYLRFNPTKELFDEVAIRAFNLTIMCMSSDAVTTPQIIALWEKHKEEILNSENRHDLLQMLKTHEKVQTTWQQNIFPQVNGASRAVHPSPVLAILQNINEFEDRGVLELFLLSPQYCSNMIKIAKWIAKTILRDVQKNSESDQMTLLLQGRGGSGKTTIADSLQQELNGYKWELNTQYQNPCLAFNSLIHISDCEIDKHLATADMVKIMGFQEACMVNSKNQHPIEMTYQTPVVITTNSDIKQYYKNSNQKQQRAVPVCRRMFTVNFQERFADIIGLPQEIPQVEGIDLKPAIERVKKLKHLDRKAIVNTLFGLALPLLTEEDEIKLPPRMALYLKHCFCQLQKTLFGKLYLENVNQDPEFMTLIEDQFASDNEYTNENHAFDALATRINIDFQTMISKCLDLVKKQQLARTKNMPKILIKAYVKQVFSQDEVEDFEAWLFNDEQYVRCPNLYYWWNASNAHNPDMIMFDTSGIVTPPKNQDSQEVTEFIDTVQHHPEIMIQQNQIMESLTGRRMHESEMFEEEKGAPKSPPPKRQKTKDWSIMNNDATQFLKGNEETFEKFVCGTPKKASPGDVEDELLARVVEASVAQQEEDAIRRMSLFQETRDRVIDGQAYDLDQQWLSQTSKASQ